MRSDKPIVLVVDDTPLNLEILLETLADAYTLRVAVDGASALRNVKNAPPDIILLDIMMPGMDGFEVCRRLKADPVSSSIPVIFLTSLNDSVDEGRGLALGAVDYITKPFNPDLVRARLRNHIELAGYRRNLEDLVATKTSEIATTRRAAIVGMAIIAEFRDTETGSHILRTKEYMRTLAETLCVPGSGFVFEDIELLAESATLHDIGKVGIPDAVLRKPGPLTEAEFAVIKTHPALGWRIVERTVAMTGANVLLRYAGEIARSHHEKYDGSGYPDGLVGDQIPASAQLMALADVYDALVSHRVYKAAGSHEDAMRIILEGDGRVMPSHFNPKVLEAFVHSSQRFRDIALRFAG